MKFFQFKGFQLETPKSCVAATYSAFTRHLYTAVMIIPLRKGAYLKTFH